MARTQLEGSGRGTPVAHSFPGVRVAESPAVQPGLTRRPRVAWLPQHTPGTTTSAEAEKTCKCALTFSLELSGTLHPSQRRATHLPLQDVHLTEISNPMPAFERLTGAQLRGQLLQPKPTQAQGARRAGRGGTTGRGAPEPVLSQEGPLPSLTGPASCLELSRLGQGALGRAEG